MATMSWRVKYTFLDFYEDDSKVTSSRSLSAGALRGPLASPLCPEDNMPNATRVTNSALDKKRWADYEEDDVSTDISSDRDPFELTASGGDEAQSCEDTFSFASLSSGSLDICPADVAACLPEQHSIGQQHWYESWEHGAQEWGMSQQQWQPQQQRKKQKEQQRQKKQQQKPQQGSLTPFCPPPAPQQGFDQGDGHAQASEQLPVTKRMATKSEVVSCPSAKSCIKETAVMLRNIPSAFGREDVIATLNSLGFKDTFDVVFLPMTVTCSANFGYVFVNFLDMQHAEQLSRVLNESSFSTTHAEQRCEVTPAKQHGRANLGRHMRRYNARRNSMLSDVSSDISDKPHDLFE